MAVGSVKSDMILMLLPTFATQVGKLLLILTAGFTPPLAGTSLSPSSLLAFFTAAAPFPFSRLEGPGAARLFLLELLRLVGLVGLNFTSLDSLLRNLANWIVSLVGNDFLAGSYAQKPQLLRT